MIINSFPYSCRAGPVQTGQCTIQGLGLRIEDSVLSDREDIYYYRVVGL